ncbi:MAG: hypothetical protein OXG05_09710, partial [Gammaproteobacteria bacterium]|nr:hypothetical protein [Gammaproteobacteria bacterium]
QGKTIRDALVALMYVFAAEIAYHEEQDKTPFEMIGRAPDEYWDLIDSESAIDIPVDKNLTGVEVATSPQLDRVALLAA